MKRVLIAVAFCGLFAAAAISQSATQAGPSRPVVIDAVAFDRDHNPVTDLRQEEVEVWIGGYRVPIEAFEAVTPANDPGKGRLIVLVLDDVTLPLQLVPRARDVARRFVNRMAPGDEMAIVLLNGAVMESTSDRARLLRTIEAYHVRPSGVMRIDELGAHVLNTVATLAGRLAEAPDHRGVIVAIGASWLFDRPIPPPSVSRDLRAEWTAAMRALAIAHASLYVIEPAGVGMSPVGGGSGGFAHATGGHTFLNTNDLTGAADRIMRETAHYYLIAVADPPIQRKADLRALEVRVSRRGVTMRAREFIPGTQ